jgi:hypothetical protein
MATRARATTLTRGTIHAEEAAAEPLTQQRRPEAGQFRLQVDRQTKASYGTYEAAEEAGKAIKREHPILLVAVYNATTGENKFVELPAARAADA